MIELDTVNDDCCVAISMFGDYFIDLSCRLLTCREEVGYFDMPRWIGGSF